MAKLFRSVPLKVLSAVIFDQSQVISGSAGRKILAGGSQVTPPAKLNIAVQLYKWCVNCEGDMDLEG